MSSKLSNMFRTLTNVAGRVAAHVAKSNGAWQVNLFSYDADGRVATRYLYTQANGGASVLTAVNTTVIYTHLTAVSEERALRAIDALTRQATAV